MRPAHTLLVTLLSVVACGDNLAVPGPVDAAVDGLAGFETNDPGVLPLTIDPPSNDFGSVLSGLTVDATFVVTNPNTLTTNAPTLSISGTDAAEFTIVSTSCGALAPSASCNVVIEFSPMGPAGARTASLTVAVDPGGTTMAGLSGIALAGSAAALAISPSTTTFSVTEIGQISAAQTITLTNTGAAATGTIGNQLGGSDPAQFTIADDQCTGAVLQPGATCTLTAAFSPTATGSASASVTYTASPGNPVTASLVGNAIEPAQLAVTPSPADYGFTTFGGPKSLDLVVTNPSSSVVVGPLTQSITGADALQWTIVASTCLGASLAPGASCTVTVGFAPTTVGALAATLVVAGSPGRTGTGTLLGSCCAPDGLTITTASPFADTLVGHISASQTLTVTNPGGVATGTLATALGGNDPGQFTIVSDTCAGSVLAPDGQCTITVAFAPTDAVPSHKQATVSVGGTPGGVVVAGLSGNANAAAAALTASPPTIDFGDVIAGDRSGAADVTITNTGGVTSGVLSATLSGSAEIVELADGCSGTALAAGAACTITVQLAPLTLGSKVAALAITGAPGETAAVSITGNGVSGEQFLAITGSEVFDATVVGQTSAAKTITVSNVGTVATGPLVTALGDPSQFTIVGNTCEGFALPPNLDCSITVAFTPTVTGTSATSVLVAGDPGGVASTGVSGTGLAPPARSRR